ncbi:hypothetical protein CcaCcLH18_12492 [Colletotrichum camelliae]|nr:hypothetical protein CcaCcLH18_12492 [Colletotrichum camelliae]
MKLPPGSVDFYNSFAKVADGDAILPEFARVFTMKKLPEKLSLFAKRQVLPMPKEPGYVDMFEEVMAMRPPSCVWTTLKNICSKIVESTQKEPTQKESTQKEETQKESTQKEPTQKESTQKEPTTQEETKQNGPAKGEPKDGAGISSQVYDDFIETSKWLVTLMKQGEIVASTETVVDYSRFKNRFERFDKLLEKLAEGGAASTLWAITEGEEMQNLQEAFFCTLREDKLAEKVMKEHKKKSVAWEAAARVAGVAAFYGCVLIVGGPIAASIIGSSCVTWLPFSSCVVGTWSITGTAVTTVAAAGAAVKSNYNGLSHTASLADCTNSCEQINTLHASFQSAFQNVLRILLIRLAKHLEVSYFLHNGDPALRSHFLDAYGIDLKELGREEYSIEYLRQEQRRLRHEFHSLTGEINKFSDNHGFRLPHE